MGSKVLAWAQPGGDPGPPHCPLWGLRPLWAQDKWLIPTVLVSCWRLCPSWAWPLQRTRGCWLDPRPACQCSPLPQQTRPQPQGEKDRRDFDRNPHPEPSPWNPSVWGLTGIGPGHCEVLLVVLPGNTWGCNELGPRLPQPKGQRDGRDGQTGTRDREEGHTGARARRRSCHPSRSQGWSPDPGARPGHMALGWSRLPERPVSQRGLPQNPRDIRSEGLRVGWGGSSETLRATARGPSGDFNQKEQGGCPHPPPTPGVLNVRDHIPQTHHLLLSDWWGYL